MDGWHAAQELGARTVWMGGTRLRSMGSGPAGHAAQELEEWARGVWMGGTRLFSRAPPVLMHVHMPGIV